MSPVLHPCMPASGRLSRSFSQWLLPLQLGLALALGAANPAAWAGPLTGQTLGRSGSHVDNSLSAAVVGNGAEFSVVGFFLFDFSEDGGLSLRTNGNLSSVTFVPGNVYVFSDIFGTIASIESVELINIGAGVSGFDPSSMLSFTADSLTLNLAGASWSRTSEVQLQIHFAADPAATVPEPTTAALAGLALAALAGVSRRR